MKIQEMFTGDIDRKINGVVKVEQDAEDVLATEVEEYVVTGDIKKHLVQFFDSFAEGVAEQSADIGVWISGFFGSGKSHLLKMLSCLMSNREIKGRRTVEYFRDKFDDNAGFMPIEKAINDNTETILFNVDIEGSIDKDATVILRTFAKVFYNHCGYYGDDLQFVRLEQYIDKMGKRDEFRETFARICDQPWADARRSYRLKRSATARAMSEVLGISESDARDWLSDKQQEDFSIKRLVSDIKEYIDAKPADYRLLFMADEIGQYVAESIDLLVNLQSVVEEIGRLCGGRVWVVCTGQEAVDSLVNGTSDELRRRRDNISRGFDRFKTRISLSSTSVKEVIEKRILEKTPDAKTLLENVYGSKDAVLKNLYTFKDARQTEIKGFAGAAEFSRTFPFVPYQYPLMQSVFATARARGVTGKNISSGERSLLSAFQEVLQRVKDGDEGAVAPFYLFYDSLHGSLDSTIRRVIERCEEAAGDGDVLKPIDVKVLKLLYLLLGQDNLIPATLDNIVILMADNIDAVRQDLRTLCEGSLRRLMAQHYIMESGGKYRFLNDEEQDIAREIGSVPVSPAKVSATIASVIFTEIYADKKLNVGCYNYAYTKYVDDAICGSAASGGLELKIYTEYGDSSKTTDAAIALSPDCAFVVFPGIKRDVNGKVPIDEDLYGKIERNLQVDAYATNRNIAKIPESTAEIIKSHINEANRRKVEIKKLTEQALVDARYYVDGRLTQVSGSAAAEKLDGILQSLAASVYKDRGLIKNFVSTDAEIAGILRRDATMGAEFENKEAESKVLEYLTMQSAGLRPTTMLDIQNRYQARPYGWREIDIAAVTAALMADQKITIRYGGLVISPDSGKLPDILRKKTMTGDCRVSIREAVLGVKLQKARKLAGDYFDSMDVPADEDGLVSYIDAELIKLQNKWNGTYARYNEGEYPGEETVKEALNTVSGLLGKNKDNSAFIDAFIDAGDELSSQKGEMKLVENFWQNQRAIYDEAKRFLSSIAPDTGYMSDISGFEEAIGKIRSVTAVSDHVAYDYSAIPSLKGLMSQIKVIRQNLLIRKRAEITDICGQMRTAVESEDDGSAEAREIIERAEECWASYGKQIEAEESLALLDSKTFQMTADKDRFIEKLHNLKTTKTPPSQETPAPKNIKTLHRQAIFPARTLSDREAVETYVEEIRAHLIESLDGCDGIRIS